MYCKICGSLLTAQGDKLICPQCGAEYVRAANLTPMQSNYTPMQNNYTPAETPDVKPRGFSSKKNILIIILAAVVALCLGAGITIFAMNNTSEHKVSRGIELAERYFSELNYGQAITEYEKVIEIEPKNVEAYLGLAEVYEEMGNIDKAIEILKKGVEQTHDDRLQRHLDELLKPETASSITSAESTASTPISSSEASTSNETSISSTDTSSVPTSTAEISSSAESTESVESTTPNSLPSQFETTDANLFAYVFDPEAGGMAINGYMGDEPDIIVPAIINGIRVVKVNFKENTVIKNVVLLNGLTKIETQAFAYCTNLESITIPKSVTTIGECAFEKCESLKSITIPDSVTTIEWGAFQKCTSLKSVTIPYGITTIEGFTFAYDTNLESVIIPNSVTEIGNAAFSDTNLKSISIPNSVKLIGEGAFSSTSLEDVVIPDSVEAIYGGAFWDCANLWRIKIPDEIHAVGDDSFHGCPKLIVIYKGEVYDLSDNNDYEKYKKALPLASGFYR